ncbi:hypothetical protein [Paenibacillus plantarum]|nr:hypothetical protein [Paenibacillus plantarum]
MERKNTFNEIAGEIIAAIEENGGTLIKPQAVVLFLAKKSNK